ncbi:unnamed protein product [Sphagnum jensenii]|uniref:Uncharacterized protein n=1 Tax=Sphagnum jensenii TaxID=128206 RepID=A0ABP1A5F7_9BRYO
MTRRDSGSSCAAIPGPRRRATLAGLALARRPTRHSWRLVVRKVFGASSSKFFLPVATLPISAYDLPGLIHRLPIFRCRRSID